MIRISMRPNGSYIYKNRAHMRREVTFLRSTPVSPGREICVLMAIKSEQGNCVQSTQEGQPDCLHLMTWAACMLQIQTITTRFIYFRQARLQRTCKFQKSAMIDRSLRVVRARSEQNSDPVESFAHF